MLLILMHGVSDVSRDFGRESIAAPGELYLLRFVCLPAQITMFIFLGFVKHPALTLIPCEDLRFVDDLTQPSDSSRILPFDWFIESVRTLQTFMLEAYPRCAV